MVYWARPWLMRAQIVDIAKHVGERHHGVDHGRVAACFLATNLPAPAGEIARDTAHIFLGRDHFDLHHRFQELRVGLQRGFPESGPDLAISNAMTLESTSW